MSRIPETSERKTENDIAKKKIKRRKRLKDKHNLTKHQKVLMKVFIK